MAHAPRPHISHALQHLRVGVFAAGTVLAVACFFQLACWTVIHFGGPNTTRLEPTPGEGQAAVVHAEPRDKPEPQSGEYDGGASSIDTPPATADDITTTSSSTPTGYDAATVSINEVPTGASLIVSRVADTSQIVGLVAAIALVVFMIQGVAVAGGGAVPGVEMVVTASTWAFVLAALATPWSGFLPEVTFGGVLRSGEAMREGVRLHEAGDIGAAAYYGIRVLLPLLMMGGACACVLRFRAGIRRGIIVTHASMLDQQLEAELRKRKIGEGATPRSVGALNSAIGEAPAAPQEAAPPPPMAPPPAAASVPTSPMRSDGPVPGRPI